MLDSNRKENTEFHLYLVMVKRIYCLWNILQRMKCMNAMLNLLI